MHTVTQNMTAPPLQKMHRTHILLYARRVVSSLFPWMGYVTAGQH